MFALVGSPQDRTSYMEAGVPMNRADAAWPFGTRPGKSHSASYNVLHCLEESKAPQTGTLTQ